ESRDPFILAIERRKNGLRPSPRMRPFLEADDGTQTLFTIGYEKARLGDVVAALAAAGVATLIDVRDRPISRRPGFSKRQLAAAIEDAGMRYVHLAALGTPPEGRLADPRR